jgi:hypothetical protein
MAWRLSPPGVPLSSPVSVAESRRPVRAMALRPDCRRFLCDFCQCAVYICSWCDRGQRYCSRRCSQAARRRTWRESGRRYQQSRGGRRAHARRQATYRQRRAVRRCALCLHPPPGPPGVSKKKVTHQGSPRETSSGTVVACTRPTPTPDPTQPSIPPATGPDLRCAFCGAPCQPWVRHDFLRCRRPRRAWRQPQEREHDDPCGAGGTDPPPLYR